MAASIPQANGPKSQVLIRVPASKLPTSLSPVPLRQLSSIPSHLSVPAVQCSEPNAAQDLSVFGFIVSDLARDSSLLGSFIQHVSCSSSLSSANLIHMLLAALAKPLIKMTRKERAESRALKTLSAVCNCCSTPYGCRHPLWCLQF